MDTDLQLGFTYSHNSCTINQLMISTKKKLTIDYECNNKIVIHKQIGSEQFFKSVKISNSNLHHPYCFKLKHRKTVIRISSKILSQRLQSVYNPFFIHPKSSRLFPSLGAEDYKDLMQLRRTLFGGVGSSQNFVKFDLQSLQKNKVKS